MNQVDDKYKSDTVEKEVISTEASDNSKCIMYVLIGICNLFCVYQ